MIIKLCITTIFKIIPDWNINNIEYGMLNKTKYSNLNRSLKIEEYNEVVNYAYDLGIRNAFIQDLDSSSDDFIPNFDINIL